MKLACFVMLSGMAMAQIVNPSSYPVAVVTPGSDFGVQVKACFDGLPSSGGICDARNTTGTQSLSANLVLSKSNAVLLLCGITLNMGSFQITKASGVNNVLIQGCVPNGNSSIPTGVAKLVYTGTSAAISAGDTSADSFGFSLQNISIDTTGADATTGKAILLTREINYRADDVTLYQATGANTQRGYDLEGPTNQVSGTIFRTYITNGYIGIYYGPNANLNGVYFARMTGNLAGYCHYFAGSSGNPAGQNQASGGYCVNKDTAVYMDFASTNNVMSQDFENLATRGAQYTANALGNKVEVQQQAGTAIAYSDASSQNWFITAQGILSPGYNSHPVLQPSFGFTTNSGADTSGWIDSSAALFYYFNGTASVGYNHSFKVFGVDAQGSFGFFAHGSPGNGCDGTCFFEKSVGVFDFGNTGTSDNIGGTIHLATLGACSDTSTCPTTVDVLGVHLPSIALASLGTPANGTMIYCSDCKNVIDNSVTAGAACAGSGAGAIARRENGHWACN